MLSRNCPLRKHIKQLFLSSFSQFFLLCPLYRKDSVKSLKISNLKFAFILKWINNLNRYHNQYLPKLLAISLCFLIFDVNLVIVKCIIYNILACNFYVDICIVFHLLFRNKMLNVNVKMLKCIFLCFCFFPWFIKFET